MTLSFETLSIIMSGRLNFTNGDYLNLFIVNGECDKVIYVFQEHCDAISTETENNTKSC